MLVHYSFMTQYDTNNPLGTTVQHQQEAGRYHGGGGEEVGVVAALLEVHHYVEEGDLVPPAAGVQRLKVTRQDELVVFPGEQEKS